MASESLFTILSRQPWWLSMLVGALLFAAMQLIFPALAPFVALPFIGIGAWLGWKQLRAGVPFDVPERLAKLREMPWENFSLVVSEAYRRQGYTVEPSKSGAFDFRLRKNNRLTLVQCRRWKVSQVGENPLRELNQAIEKQDAYNAIAITAGEFSEKARSFVATTPITLVSGAELIKLVGRLEKRRSRWWMR
ncbi:MAG: restriction endonuclease [Betaproteobacteria bacterium]|nr:restriction endonuclease [Betaproteobacteria bacterium]